MIPFLAMLVTGLLFGYLIVGPFNRGYSALEWAGVMFVCGGTYGVLIIVALTLTSSTGDLEIVRILIACAFALLYALSAAIGVYFQQRGKKK